MHQDYCLPKIVIWGIKWNNCVELCFNLYFKKNQKNQTNNFIICKNLYKRKKKKKKKGHITTAQGNKTPKKYIKIVILCKKLQRNSAAIQT